MEPIYELCVVARTLVDCKITFITLKLFAVLIMHLNYKKWAISMFELLRDLAYEQFNWSFLLQSFDLLGRGLQQKRHYAEAMIAYKKML